MTNVVTQIAEDLSAVKDEFDEALFAVKLIDTEDGVVIEVRDANGINAMPVFIDADDDQIRVVADLWSVDEFKPEVREEVWRNLLKLHVPMSLSSFGIEGQEGDEHVILFGSLSTDSSLDNLVEEVTELMANAEQVLLSGDKILVA